MRVERLIVEHPDGTETIFAGPFDFDARGIPEGVPFRVRDAQQRSRRQRDEGLLVLVDRFEAALSRPRPA